jgi:pimeloyl-ACP methyl ester carboxylesterase
LNLVSTGRHSSRPSPYSNAFPSVFHKSNHLPHFGEDPATPPSANTTSEASATPLVQKPSFPNSAMPPVEQSPTATQSNLESVKKQDQVTVKKKRGKWRWFRRIAGFLTLLAATTPGNPPKTKPVMPAPTVQLDTANQKGTQRVFVIHSGVSDDTNWAAKAIKNNLIQLGVQDSNIIILDNPYPDLTELNDFSLTKAKDLFVDGLKRNMNHLLSGESPETPILFKLIKTLYLYQTSSDDGSYVVDHQYQQMADKMNERGLDKADVVWVGYSAGGQMGLSVAKKIDQDLEQQRKITTVITMGTPIRKNPTPSNFKIIVLNSNGDTFLNAVISYPRAIGLQVDKQLTNPGDQDHELTVEDLSHTDLPNDLELIRRAIQLLPPRPSDEKK